ncbi:FAD-binding protein [Micromonospora sp. NBC_01699]|uniref:cholesterol oxidase substrate-binding domain-containing protein n=1 Tax=Micromonospora sp. NBC_01699 TaxID=2975984 RepID=UPI002E308055|nr:cholesterol oxidase substrate-binding domain-containing protein [Micromonospora sp. NBC_01699]
MTLTRRGFLEASAVTALGPLWTTTTDRSTPPGFPTDIAVYREAYRNWAGEIRATGMWTCVPRTAADVVTVVNWAYEHGFTVRPRGYRHTWSPLTVPDGADAERVILVDTTRELTAMAIVSTAPAAVRVQTGASMEDLLTFLEQHGLGVTNTPAPGELTVGGVLAINGHGTSVPADGEIRTPGHTYGTLSNLILSVTAVVWDAATDGYVLRTFDRADPACTALLTHVGRAFLTEVTLRVGANQNLRCVSSVDIPASELFAPPGSGARRTLASFVATAGRVEAIWFAFTGHPWLKVWSVSPQRPLTSRPVFTPYNYVFSDNVPEPVAVLAEQLLNGAWALAPTFGRVQYTTAAAGLTATLATDLWGPSKNLLLYVKPTTLREHANGYAVHTSRNSIQRVVSEFAGFYERQLAAYQARGEFPVTGQVEIRVAGLDRATDVGVPGAEPPALSAARPRADHPEWDVVVWFDVLTFSSAPGAHRFYREMEWFFFANYSGTYAGCRVEWSKGWGYTDTAAWAEPSMLGSTVPESYRQGPDPTWDRAVAALDAYDPHRLFSNPFLDLLLPRPSR